MKEFTATFKFSDVIETIPAKNKKEAEKIADGEIQRINETTFCYEVEIEEIKE